MRIILNGSIDLYEDGIDFEDLDIEIIDECNIDECDIEDYMMDCEECGFRELDDEDEDGFFFLGCDEEYDDEEDRKEYIDNMIDDYVDLMVELGTRPDYIEKILIQLVEEILYLTEDE